MSPKDTGWDGVSPDHPVGDAFSAVAPETEEQRCARELQLRIDKRKQAVFESILAEKTPESTPAVIIGHYPHNTEINDRVRMRIKRQDVAFAFAA